MNSPFPLWLKIAHTVFVVLLVPVYWRHYGAQNFLWLSDIALFAVTINLWLGSSLLASMMALGVLVLEFAWNLDFFGRLVSGRQLFGLSSYMFDEANPFLVRTLSLFHIWLPFLLLWFIHRLGYDSRAWYMQTAATSVIFILNPLNVFL